MISRRGIFIEVLIAFLLVLFLVQGARASSGVDSSAWVFRGEFCFEPSGAEAVWDDVYLGARADVRAFQTRDASTRVYVMPRVVYNSVKGLDFQLGVGLEWHFVEFGHNFQVTQGTRFPINFLHDCVLYVRVNLSE